MRLSFTSKVFVAILGMTVFILGGVIFFFQRNTTQIADKEINRRLTRASLAFQNFQDTVYRKLYTINYYISANADFKAYMINAIDNYDQASVLDQFEEIQRFSNADFMIVLDPYGDVVVDTTDEIANELGDTLMDFTQAVDGSDLPIGTVYANNHFYNMVASPLTTGGFISGYVIVGYLIDDASLEDLSRISNCDVLVLSSQNGRDLAASSFEDNSMPITDREWEAALANVDLSDGIFTFTVADNAYKGLAIPLVAPSGAQVGHYLTVRSLASERQAFVMLIRGVFIIGLIAFVVLAPLSVMAAQRVTKPINSLVDTIERVREGEYDERLIQVESKDEIGVMARAFKGMIRELREQRELIEFLEQSAAQKPSPTQSIHDLTSQTLPLGQSNPNHSHSSFSATTSRVRETLSKDGQLPKGFLLGNRYEILGVLGRGGMGVVYRAKDLTLDDIVAIKMLHVDNAELADMLKQETKLARKVTHRNIVRIYDLGELEGVQFISMELVNGTTLKALLARVKRLPLSIGLRITDQVCRGLGAAHKEGIIHGDIKPENVIINPRGEIKIMDFGVARVATLKTSENVTSGTPAYMSPEQFQGTTIDQRADIYSLGIMMYEFFAGSVPYNGKTLVELFKKHMAAPLPPLMEINPKVPETMVAVIAKATAKSANQRFANTREMLEALKLVHQGGE